MIEVVEKFEFEWVKEFCDQFVYIELMMEKQKMIMNDFLDCDVFVYVYDKGWMCVQVFFICQGKLIECDVSMFLMYQEVDEEFLIYIGQFYFKNNYFLFKEILVFDSVDRDMISEFLEIVVYQLKKGLKKELFLFVYKNVKIVLWEKFLLIEWDEEWLIGAVEWFGEVLNIYMLYWIEVFDNFNI